MSWKKLLAKLLLYQKLQPVPVVFESGIEDRPPQEGGRAGEGGESEPGAGRGQPESGQQEAGAFNGEGVPTGADGGTFKRPGAGGATGKTGLKGKVGGRKGFKKRGTRKRKERHAAVEEKYSDKLAENQEIGQILINKVELSYRLEENEKVLKKIFRFPENKDAVFRNLSIGTEPPAEAILVFIDGITNAQVQNMAVLQPLMLFSGARDRSPERQPGGGGTKPGYKDFFDRVKQAMLPNNQVAEALTYDQVVYDVLNGNSALFIEGYNQALLLETKGWHFRSVNAPQVEAVIRGPQEGFTEMLRVNTSLVRKIINQPSLVTEFVKVGDAAPMQCAVMYMADLANPDLVKEVKRRLDSVRADFMQETGLVEQMIEDQPLYMVPQILTTERPDRVAASLLEGQVSVMVNGNPFVMVMPCTFFNLMQSPEDAYVRWPFGTFMRLVRYAGLLLALLLPAHYVAIVAYHQEFIPTDLLLALTGAREKVPFPSIVEVLIMEASFELIREAGIRIPGTIGTTLGIVGALILGQAAVAANIVSPILIIVVAVTALGSFAIPNYSLSLSVRLLRFAYIILGALTGLLGIMVGFFIHIGVMTTVQSFGVPFLAPSAPVTRKGGDYFLRAPVWLQETRPDYLDPLKKRRQPGLSRSWARPGAKKGDAAGK